MVRIARLPFDSFVPAVWPQVLRIRVMVPVRASVKELLSGLFASIPGVYVFCVIELLQDPVIPPFLLQDDRTDPVLRMKVSHDISIIHMALGDIQRPALPVSSLPRM